MGSKLGVSLPSWILKKTTFTEGWRWKGVESRELLTTRHSTKDIPMLERTILRPSKNYRCMY